MMEIANGTGGLVISADAEYRDGFFGRFRGLMLSPRRDIVLASRKDSVVDSTIHMMFMLYPIDVIWVNSDMTVVDVKKNVPPFNPLKPKTWKMHAPKAPAKYVIEIAKGVAGETQVGDRIRFRYTPLSKANPSS